MENYLDVTTIKLQMALNKRMFEIGQITYNTYAHVHEILLFKLTSTNAVDIINHSESK